MDTRFLTYRDFKAADFFAEDDFVRSVMPDGTISDDFWHELRSIYPHLDVEIETAVIWILLIKKQPVTTSRLSTEDRWQNLQRTIPKYTKQQDRIQSIRRIVRWSLAAASVLLVIFLFTEINQLGTKYTKTNFGERRSLLLPDSSSIQLNSNSKISYERDWKSVKPREIWLEGEALFEVRHTVVRNRIRENDYFVVHVSDLKLTVLGTRFNVKERRGKVEISLLEGRVQIDEKNGQQHILTPGETFLYNMNAQHGDMVDKEPEKTIAWTKNEIDVERYNLSDIIEILEDNYGYRVQLNDSSLLDKRLMGTIPVKSMKDILFVVRHTMEVDIHVNKKLITIQSNNNKNN